ncbi:MAG: hypothetical protein K2Y01_09100 [Rhabdochlamydiaceae bacterium]|nr:hypothetical protein [Rhabdochlamydiaceae bacterium]
MNLINTVPSHCVNIVPMINVSPKSAMCMRPDGSYQRNRKLASDYFAQESKMIVKNTGEQIQKAAQKGTVDLGFFNKLIKSVGNKRLKLAQKQKSEDADLFGGLRKIGSGDYLMTPVSDPQYESYLQKFLENIALLHKTYETELKSDTGICLKAKTQGITSYFYAQIVDYLKILNSTRAQLLGATPGQQFAHRVVTQSNMFNSRKYMDSFVYSYANTTPVTEDGKVLQGSEYFNMLPKAVLASENPIWANVGDFTSLTNTPLADHLPANMLSVYDAFAKCIQSSNKEEFSTSLSNFQYLFAHTTPYKRGSAAIAEWFTKALCQAKNYACSCNCGDLVGKCSLDLAAIASISVAEYADLFSRQMSIINLANYSGDVGVNGLLP